MTFHRDILKLIWEFKDLTFKHTFLILEMKYMKIRGEKKISDLYLFFRFLATFTSVNFDFACTSTCKCSNHYQFTPSQ